MLPLSYPGLNVFIICLKFKTLFVFTVCAVPVFKKKGFYYTKEAFEENAFPLEDFFLNKTLEKLNNKSHFSIVAMDSLIFGRCWSIQNLVKVPTFEFENEFKLTKLFDINLYLHMKGMMN